MALTVTLGNLRDDEGGRLLPDPEALVVRLCTSVRELDAPGKDYALLRGLDPHTETVLNWLQVRTLHEEVLRAANQFGLADQAKDVVAELWEWRQASIDFTWIVRVLGD
ncbi:hypothetical protein [Sporichthya sp.]|uniref:hypothetical protein n=1 Tax=Sporichthya sp. TaxID=65475 RepID=UPI0017D26068|nr:hypothetical protein [Sporichthya sp.]MBA3745045.1 hypothetical protein [Sporichthya sp.]